MSARMSEADRAAAYDLIREAFRKGGVSQARWAAAELLGYVPSIFMLRDIVCEPNALRTEGFSAADDAYAAEQEREILARREMTS